MWSITFSFIPFGYLFVPFPYFSPLSPTILLFYFKISFFLHFSTNYVKYFSLFPHDFLNLTPKTLWLSIYGVYCIIRDISFYPNFPIFSTSPYWNPAMILPTRREHARLSIWRELILKFHFETFYIRSSQLAKVEKLTWKEEEEEEEEKKRML